MKRTKEANPMSEMKQEKEWPVRVYRLTAENGWQKLQPRNSLGRKVAISATPRHNCIVLHRIQVRLRFADISMTNNNSNNNIGTTGEAATNAAADNSYGLVTRRRDRILISSQQRLKSLVLQFKDLQTCLEFSDFLVDLNPSLERSLLSGEKMYDVDTIRTMKMRHRSRDSHSGAGSHTASHIENQNAISYVGRLLQDDDFANMCDNLEACIAASEDGAQLFAALTHRSAASSLDLRHAIDTVSLETNGNVGCGSS